MRRTSTFVSIAFLFAAIAAAQDSDDSKGIIIQPFDALYTVTVTTEAPSLPLTHPDYVADGSYSVTITDGADCVGRYEIDFPFLFPFPDHTRSASTFGFDGLN